MPVYASFIGPLHLDPVAYSSLVDDPFARQRLIEDEVALIVVVGDAEHLPEPGSLPVVVAWLGDAIGGIGPAGADLVVAESDGLDRLVRLTSTAPRAAAALAVLLRQTARLPVDGALAAESAVYSMLQGSHEFANWRAERTPQLIEDGPAVLVDRRDDELTIRLNRPHRHNAITRRLRDELCDALAIAAVDDSIRSVAISGNGRSFCSGGDLGEFGVRSDPALAHLVRLVQSPASYVHRLRHRTSVRVHGATLGGGIEIAAFAHRVVADSATRIGLPEIELGLVPGAGGTVSIARRIGRQRTAALALALSSIDAATALRWGLVDAVETFPISDG